MPAIEPIKLLVLLAIYFKNTVYPILNHIPVVGIFVNIFGRIFLLYLLFLLFVVRVVRDVCNFGLRVISGCVLLTFLPVYIPMWIVTRLLFAAITVVMGDFANEHVSNGPMPLLRLIAHNLPVIGPMFVSAEEIVLGLVNIPDSIVRAIETTLEHVKTEVNAISDDVNSSPSNLLASRDVSNGKPTTGGVMKEQNDAGRESRYDDQSELCRDDESTSSTESYAMRLLKMLVYILNLFDTIIRLPSNVVTYYHRLQETYVSCQRMYNCRRTVIDKINGFKDRLAKVNSNVADQTDKIKEMQSFVGNSHPGIFKQDEELAGHMQILDKNVARASALCDRLKGEMKKVRTEYREVELTTKGDVRKLLSKVEKLVEMYEKAQNRHGINVQSPRMNGETPHLEESGRVPATSTNTTGNQDNRSKSESEAVVPLHVQLQRNAVRRYNANSSFSFPGVGFLMRWLYNID